MKKILLSLMLVFTILVGGIALVGCGNNKSNSNVNDNTDNDSNIGNHYNTQTFEVRMNMVDGSSVAVSNSTITIEYYYHGERKTDVLGKTESKQFIADSGTNYSLSYDVADQDSFCYWQPNIASASTNAIYNGIVTAGNHTITANLASCFSKTTKTSQGLITVLEGTVTESDGTYTISAIDRSKSFSYWLVNNQFLNEDIYFDTIFDTTTPSGAVVYKPVYNKMVGFVSIFSKYSTLHINDGWNGFNSTKNTFYDYAYYYFNGTNVETNMPINSGYYYKNFNSIPTPRFYCYGTIYALDNGRTCLNLIQASMDEGYGYNYNFTINEQNVSFRVDFNQK